MKAKTYAVTFGGAVYLVSAMTKAGACRDLLEHLSGQAEVELATGAQLYRAGADGQPIIGADKYANAVDPAQLTIPETEKESA